MNQKNYDYLRDSLKFLGFNESMNEGLREGLAAQSASFQLKAEHEYGQHKVNYVLDFNKSEQSDMYFFNKYNASLHNGKEEVSQNFYITKNSGITAKEAFNLLSGRAVNKDLVNAEKQPYNAWLQLSFGEKDKNDNYRVKQYTSGYGYDLEKVLATHPIKELADPAEKEKLVRSLERGNVHAVSFEKEGAVEKMFVQANPQYKNLIVYDSQMRKQYSPNGNRNSQDKSTSASVAQDREAVKKNPEKSESVSGGRKKKGHAI